MKKPTLKFKKDARGKYRWQLFRGNSKILDAASQGFSTKAGALLNFFRTRTAMNMVEV